MAVEPGDVTNTETPAAEPAAEADVNSFYQDLPSQGSKPVDAVAPEKSSAPDKVAAEVNTLDEDDALDSPAASDKGAEKPSFKRPDKEESRTTEAEPAKADAAAEGEVDPAVKPDDAAAEIKYEEFTLAEGQSMDQSALDALVPLAKEHKLSQGAVQSIVNIAADMIKRGEETNAKLLSDQVATWKKTAAEDREIGGLNQAKALDDVDKFAAQFGSKEFVDLLNDTDLIYHPEMVRAMARAGASISEDQITTSGKEVTTKKEFSTEDFYKDVDVAQSTSH